jgi:hypothetical protein
VDGTGGEGSVVRETDAVVGAVLGVGILDGTVVEAVLDEVLETLEDLFVLDVGMCLTTALDECIAEIVRDGDGDWH